MHFLNSSKELYVTEMVISKMSINSETDKLLGYESILRTGSVVFGEMHISSTRVVHPRHGLSGTIFTRNFNNDQLHMIGREFTHTLCFIRFLVFPFETIAAATILTGDAFSTSQKLLFPTTTNSITSVHCFHPTIASNSQD